MTGDPPTPFRAPAALVGVGGAAGATARWGIVSLASIGSAWPWPTLLVNVVGCFVVGLLLRAPRTIVLLLGVGFAGGLTTFSTFSLEIAALLRAGDATTGLTYTVVSLALGTLAVLAGRRMST